MTTILIKKKDTTGAPSSGDLTNATGGAEIAVNTFDKRLYTKNSGGTIVEVGTNPTEMQIDNINIDGNTISSTNTNGNIVLAPNGTGDVQVDADTLRVGDSNVNATLTTNGTGDLILNTNAGTNSGSITIEDGTNGNITINPNGSGRVTTSALSATSPRVITAINDTNGNELFGVTATGSAVNEFTVANAATGNAPTLSATGGDTNIGMALTPKGTGGVIFPAGAVGTPAITTTGDLNTGIFFPAADTIAFAEGGAEAMRIDSSGRTLIGSTSSFTAGEGQYARLQIVASTQSATGAACLSLGRGLPATSLASGATLGRITFSDNAGNDYAQILAATDATSGSSDYPGRLQFYTTPDGSATLTERMRIDSSGNVGIGTSSPGAKLSVIVSSYNDLDILQLAGSEPDRYNLKIRNAYHSNGAIGWNFRTRDNNTDYDYNLMLVGGNVGIGTSSPNVGSASAGNAILTLAGNASGRSGIIELQTVSNTTSTNAIGLLRFYNGTNENSRIESRIEGSVNDAANLGFLTRATGGSLTERMRITSSGNVLVGTTSDTGKIRIVASDTDNVIALNISQNRTSSIVPAVSIYNNYTSVGTATAAEFLDHTGVVRGTITVTTAATAYNTTSDYRLKENIAPMTGALAKVAALKPCTYTWKANGSAGEGFIAHELQEVCPEAVTGEKDEIEIKKVEVSPAVYEDVVIPAVFDEDNNEVEPERIEKRLVSEAVMEDREVPRYQGVDTSFLVATLTAAIQELKAELDTVKAELATLKGN